MLKKEEIKSLKTNALGEAKKRIEVSGYIEEINIDFGEIEQDAKTTIVGSQGTTVLDYTGNNNLDFPVNPRHSIDTESRMVQIATEGALELLRYANVGFVTIQVENAGANKSFGLIEIVFEE